MITTQEPPVGVSLENWSAALALRPAHITPDDWKAACRAGAEQERRKALLVARRRETLGLACYLAGADEWSALWKDLPESVREAYRAIACDPYTVSALAWSPAAKNIVVEYARETDTYQPMPRVSVAEAQEPTDCTPPTDAPRYDHRFGMRVDAAPAKDAIRRLLQGAG